MTSAAFAAGNPGQGGTTLSASKTATGSLTRTFQWTIDKSVSPAAWSLFTGDGGTSEYTVSVTKDGGTLEAYLDGEICVTNGGSVATENLQIIDQVSKPPSNTVIASVTVDLSANPVLDPGESYCYDYRVDIPGGNIVPGGTYKNTADVTITNHSGHLGEPFGPNPSATTTLPASATLVNDTINVDDTNGGSWPFSDDGSVSYEKTFTCDADEGSHNNTATIRETGQSDSASVTVNCYELTVTKDADTSFDRTWNWTIDKSADQTSLTLADGQLFQVNYQVLVNATSTDGNFAVSGNISINNPAPIDATINTVSDIVSPGIAADVDCKVTFPHTLAAGETLTCAYIADLPDASNRLNTASATLQNYSYNSEGVGTPGGTTDFSGTASVAFSTTPTNLIDDCIDASDTNIGLLGTVCADDAPKTFTYSLTFGKNPNADVQLECGDNTHTNVADFKTNGTGATGQDSATVSARVNCAAGCTLTPGYWKTHSQYGPAAFDDTWNLIGANSPFFLSGKTYYQALWTAPQGNAYYILAHAYIAAKLNQLNGASIPANVLTAYNQATVLLNTYTPAQVAALRGNSPVRGQFINLASTLDSYNDGLTGPGHCSE
jgi:hypothetical protein